MIPGGRPEQRDSKPVSNLGSTFSPASTGSEITWDLLKCFSRFPSLTEIYFPRVFVKTNGTYQCVLISGNIRLFPPAPDYSSWRLEIVIPVLHESGVPRFPFSSHPGLLSSLLNAPIKQADHSPLWGRSALFQRPSKTELIFPSPNFYSFISRRNVIESLARFPDAFSA